MNERVKEFVRQKYAQIARNRNAGAPGCGCSCGTGSQPEVFSMMDESYLQIQGYERDADLGLGCGVPTRYADIQPGETIVDLGSGAGNDAFVAARETGAEGKVFGIDMTPEMIDRAAALATARQFGNVSFLLGDIENIPLPGETADCVISNCVLNLVPDKQTAFSEMHRIIKPGGRFSVSDIVLEGSLPAEMLKSAELYAGCVAGALQREAYLEIARAAGFTSVEVVSEREIPIPDAVLGGRSLNGARVLSITVNGKN